MVPVAMMVEPPAATSAVISPFGCGATLVVMDDDAVRLGPDLVPWLRRERITVFCPPPTLLRMTACEDPARELPDLKLLYVGGEELPPDVAYASVPGMLNSISVPDPGALDTANFPPKFVARSCIPRMP